MKISVNIPSYKRPNVETLAYLPFCRVWVDECEGETYKMACAGSQAAEIIICPPGVQGNLCRVRNHIIKCEFERGMDVVAIVDDDMEGMYYFETDEIGFAYTRHKVESENFMAFLEKHSQMAKDIGAKFWGVNVNSDGQCYRQYAPISTTSYIGGPFQVFLEGNQCLYDEALPLKEDYDMTLQQLNRERIALRFNKFFYNVRQSSQAGGCAAYRNYEREKQQLEALQRKWGKKIVKFDMSDKSHKSTKTRKVIDYNPIIHPPIRGI